MKDNVKWAVIGIPAIALSIAALWWLDVELIGAIVNGSLFGTGIALLIRGVALAKHARKNVRLPFAASVFLLILPVLQLLSLRTAYQIVMQTLAIVSILVLAWYVWQHLSAGAERRDDDVKRGGFEVWK